MIKVGNGKPVPITKTVEKIDHKGGDPVQMPLDDRHNMNFSATLVVQGTGCDLVVNTGNNTEISTPSAPTLPR